MIFLDTVVYYAHIWLGTMYLKETYIVMCVYVFLNMLFISIWYIGVKHSLIFRNAIDSTVHSTILKLVGCIVETSRAFNEKNVCVDV